MQSFIDEIIQEKSLVKKLELLQKGFNNYKDGDLLIFFTEILKFEDLEIIGKLSYEIIMNLLKFKRKITIINTKEMLPTSTPADFLDETLNLKSEELLNEIIQKLPEYCLSETLVYILSKQDVPKIIKVDCGRLLRIVLERKDGLNSILHFIQEERLFFVNLIVKKDEKFIKNIIEQIQNLKIDYNLTLVIERLMDLNPIVTNTFLLQPLITKLINRKEWSDEEMKIILKNVKKYFGNVRINNQEALLVLFKIYTYLYIEGSKEIINFHFDNFDYVKKSFKFEYKDQFIYKVEEIDLDKEYSNYIEILKSKKNDNLNKNFLLKFKEENHKIIETFKNELMEGTLKEYHLIINDINDQKIPIQTYGVSMLCKYMLKNDYKFEENIQLIESKLESEDSYLFLTCIKGLSSLASKYPTKVIPMIIKSFDKSTEKFKLLEIYMDTMQRLGDGLPKYVHYFMDLFIKNLYQQNDVNVKSSILLNISTLCDTLKMAAIPWVQYFVHSSKNILLSLKEDIMVKRASMYVLSSIIKNEIFDKDQVIEIVKLLKILQFEKDKILKQSALNLLDDVLELIKLSFPQN